MFRRSFVKIQTLLEVYQPEHIVVAPDVIFHLLQPVDQLVDLALLLVILRL